MPIDRKYERDIDLLLAEELVVSADFASWFKSRTCFAANDASVVDVFVSRSDNKGESDLVVVFEEEDTGRRFALLVEDKINARFQPEQQQRYRLRAQREIARGDYETCQILLCAPQAYIAAHPETAGFDRVITYEEIAAFLTGADPSPRGRYRANFIATAAMRNANTWTPVDDEVTNRFWDAAYRLATSEFPVLELKPLRLTKDSTWIDIRPRDLPTQPVRIYVRLKGDRGYVDLTFNRSSFALFSGPVTALLRPGMSIHQTTNSAAIRIQVDGFTTTEPLEIAMPKVRRAFAACADLIDFYRSHRQRLDRIALESQPVSGQTEPR